MKSIVMRRKRREEEIEMDERWRGGRRGRRREER
jgi:hypothetical protein